MQQAALSEAPLAMFFAGPFDYPWRIRTTVQVVRASGVDIWLSRGLTVTPGKLCRLRQRAIEDRMSPSGHEAHS